MKDRVESQLNAPVLFLNGTIRDIVPRTNQLHTGVFFAVVGDDIESVREVGYRVNYET